jgi:hypothetical protein
MGQEVMVRHWAPFFQTVRDIITHGVLNVKLAPCLEHQDRHCRERLGDRSNTGSGLWRIQAHGFTVCKAIALAQQELALSRDEDRAAESSCLGEVVEQRVHG